MRETRNERRLLERLSARAAGCPPAEDLQRYAEGATDPAVRQTVAQHLTGCGACAAALKFLEREGPTDAVTAEPPDEFVRRNEALIDAMTGSEHASSGTGGTSRPWKWGLALAAAAAVVFFGVLLPRNSLDGPTSPARRGESSTAIETLIAEDVPLPRDAFVLRWTPAAAGAGYAVRVLSSRLELLHSARELSETEYRVPETVLGSLPAGATIYWQVEARLPDGSRQVSVTFVALVE